MKPHVEIDLTDEQMEVLYPLFEKCKLAIDNGDPLLMIIGQPSRVYRRAWFVILDHDTAKGVRELVSPEIKRMVAEV